MKVLLRDLYCKLNKQCFAIVTKKLKHLQTEAKDCSWRDFKRWIEESKYQEKNLLAFSGNKQSSTKEKHHNHSFKDQKSFQHNARNNRQRDYNGGSEKKQESQKKNNSLNASNSGFQPLCYYCGNFGHFMKTKDGSSWTCPDAIAKKDPCPSFQVYQMKKGRNPKPFAVMSDTEKRREVALTTDVSF